MNNDNGSVSYSVSLDHKQMNRDKQDVVNIFHEIGREAEQQGERVDHSFNSAAKNISRAFAAIGIAATMKEFGTQIMKVRGEFQKLEVAFEVMLGSAKDADALMKQLTRTAATTPFDLQGVANGAKQLLAYGEASENVNDTLIRLGNIASGLSIPLNDLVMLYGTTMTQGRLFTQDLRQFMGRGIPLADELAKQFGVAKEQVGELVTAGKVGAEEVRKAIESMTNEGGKFNGLMEKQSQTIAGQLSNLEDAIDSMFNSIGKDTQGIISAGISGVSTLVENYETIGKILLTLVTAYGAYKTAIMLQTAVQSAHAAVEAEAAVQMNLAAMAGHTLSVEQARAAATSNLLAAAQARVKASLSGMGAVLTNPYVLATAAVVGLIYAIYRLATAESSQAKGTREANDEIERQNNLLNERRQKIDALIKTVQDQNATAVQQAEAYRELQTLAPSLTDKYSQQELATLEAAKAQKALNEQLDAAKYAQLQKNISDTEARIKGLERQMQTAAAAATQGGSMTASVIASQIAKNQSALETYKKQLAEYEAARRQAEKENRPLDIKISEANNTLEEARTVFTRLEAEMQAEQEKVRDNVWYQIPLQLIFDYNSAKKAYDEAEREAKRLQGQASKTHEQAVKEAQDAYDAAVKAEKEARKKSEVEWQAANKRLDEAKAGLKSVGIDIEAQQRKAQQQRNKAAQDAKTAANEAAQRYEAIRQANERIAQLMIQGEQQRKQHLLDMINTTEQAEINALADEGERARRQLDLNNRMQLEAIEKQKRDYIAATLQAQKEMFDAQEDLKKAQNKNYNKMTFDASGVTVDTSAYDKLIALTERAQRRAQIDDMQKNEIDMIKQSIDWGSLFGEFGSMFRDQLQPTIDRLKEIQRSPDFKDADLQDQKILSELISKLERSSTVFDGDIFKKISDDLNVYQAAMKRYMEAQQQMQRAEQSVKNAQIALDEAEKTNNAVQIDTSKKNLKKMTDAYNEAATQTQRFAVEASNAADSLNESSTKAVEMFETLDSAISNLSSGSLKGIGNGMMQLDKLLNNGKITETVGNALAKGASKLFGSNSAVSKALAEGLGKGGFIAQIISAILSILDVLAEHGIGGLVQGIIDAVLGAVNGILDNILSGKFIWQIVTSLASGIGNILDTVTQAVGNIVSFGALDGGITDWLGLGGADYTSYNNLVEQYTKLIDVWDQLIDRKIEYLDISWGQEANRVGEEAIDLVNKQIDAYRRLGNERLNSGASMGSHSIGVRIRNDMEYEDWVKVAKILGRSTDDWAGLGGRLTGLFELSVEQLEKLRDEAPEFWMKLGYDVSDYLDKIIEGGERIEDMQEKVREQLTQTSFDSVYDNFVSTLMDMEADADTFSKDVSKMFMQAMLSNEIGKIYQNKLRSWYEKFASGMEDGTLSDTERSSLQTEYENYVREAIRIRDELASVTGYDSRQSDEQEASRGGYETVSEETGTQLLGRETATLMQATRAADILEEHVPAISQNQVLTISLIEAQNEFIFNCQNYLETITRNTNHLPEIRNDLHKIKQLVEQNS